MKIAAIQMCSSHVVEDNLAIASRLIREAAENAAKLVVLPEMFAIMGLKSTDKVLAKEIIGNGKIQSFLTKETRQNNIWIVGGTIPIACENENKVFAASLLFNAGGEMVARYDKIHLFDVTLSENESYKESDTTEPGRNIIVIDTPVGKLGMAVCYDVRFPELFRAMVKRDVQIISLPSAFTTKTGEAHWELLVRSRAVENFCYVIGACQGGTHSSGRQTYGHSLIVEPWGRITAKKADTEPGIIFSEIDLNHLSTIRKSIPSLEHSHITMMGD